MKHIKTVTNRLAAFTLIELLVVISIIAILASLALPAVTGALVKGQIAQTVSNYRQLYVLTQSASLDSQTAGGSGAFPGDATNGGSGIAGWSNALVPAYCSASTFNSLGAIKGNPANTTVYLVKSSEDPATMFLATVNITGTSNSLTLGSEGPYGTKGGAFVTLSGQAVSLTGTNSPQLTNGSVIMTTNTSVPF